MGGRGWAQWTQALALCGLWIQGSGLVWLTYGRAMEHSMGSDGLREGCGLEYTQVIIDAVKETESHRGEGETGWAA